MKPRWMWRRGHTIHNLEPMEDAAMGDPDEEDYVAVPEHEDEDLDQQQYQSTEDEYVNVPLDDDDKQQQDPLLQLTRTRQVAAVTASRGWGPLWGNG